MKSEIIEKLSTYITTRILKDPAFKLDPQTALITGGIIDSFNLVDLAVFAEDTFGVHLDDMELNADHFDTLDQLATLIASRVAKP